jgi:hypothetical protein
MQIQMIQKEKKAERNDSYIGGVNAYLFISLPIIIRVDAFGLPGVF